MPPPSNLYLYGYNSLQTVGWAVSLFSILISFISTGALHGGYASAGELICLLQIASFLEVIHGAIGGLFIYLFIPDFGDFRAGAKWGGATPDAMGREDSFSIGNSPRVASGVYNFSSVEPK
ncbi:Protein-tyrosine phosphatase-like, PTPLA [Parasponia andersonii]|uniref:Protein-tyrosine phosphatase-like, PTPLA n=1 Tax=Parasponia andersonii TaxID=3476 RepID=A0A2P5CDC2_PARAD|nr:Protein-tyrosine phosphatase-like, PTPLA [Parasponia andersonii]